MSLFNRISVEVGWISQKDEDGDDSRMQDEAIDNDRERCCVGR